MADNFTITQGSGTTIATDQLADLSHVQKIKLIDPTTDSSSGIGIASNPLRVDPTGATTQPVSAAQSGSWTVGVVSADLCATATGASGAAVTLTLPAVASKFHYVTGLEIVKYYSVAVIGSAAPVVVTTTNLPGSPAFTTETAGAIGTQTRQFLNPNSPVKSSVLNTATTVVCPATTSIIWRVTAYYFAAT